MSKLIESALKKYHSDGLLSTAKAFGEFVYNRSIKGAPVIHYLSSIEYLFEPNIDNIDRLKLYDNRFWRDRYSEVKNYYGLSDTELLKIYLSIGFPNRANWGEKMQAREGTDEFLGPEDYSPPPNELLKSYRKRHFEIVNRLMLGYHRYGIAEEYLRLVKDGIEPGQVSVLDYGCGVADPALYLATMGADATIVDLDTNIFDFAIWRFDQRRINHEHVRAKQTEKPVKVEGNDYDVIIMSQFLEHVRDPLTFLEFAIDKLRSGGLFYDPVGREFTHEIGGDHLKEAKEVVGSEEYQQLHQESFNRVKGDFYRRT